MSSPPATSSTGPRIPSSPSNGTAGSTAAVRPTTRRARSRTRRAVGAWLRSAGAAPCNVRVLVEGEEEIGSPTLHRFLVEHLDELRSDVLVLADAGNWAVGVPGITYSLRGLAAADIELRALDGPVHSGMAGGAIPDPVLALSRVLASLVDEHGTLAVPGIDDDARPLTDAEMQPIPGFDDDAGALRARARTPPRRRGRRRSRAPVARARVVATGDHGHRDRRSPHQGLVEPDRGARRRLGSASGSRRVRTPTG